MSDLLLILMFLIPVSLQSHPIRCGYESSNPLPPLKLHTNSLGDRRLSNNRHEDFQDIRIHVEYVNIEVSTESEEYLRNTVIDSAIDWFQNVLKIRRLKRNLTLDSTVSKRCEKDWVIPTEHLTKGVPADFILYISLERKYFVNYVGTAACCVQDGANGQPLAGYLILNYIEEWNLSYEDYLSTVIHEIVHALGFSEYLMQEFIKPTGEKYNRNELFENVQLRGRVTTLLKLPTVLAKARKNFACEEMIGVELEMSGGRGSVGSHWDKRVMYNDFMVADSDIKDVVYSDISMALLEDSGWYKVDYRYTMPIVWGYKKGCNFLQNKCVIKGKAQFSEFCTDTTGEARCDFSYLHKGSCSIGYSDDIPEEYQYFSDENLAGTDLWLDYCPIVKPLPQGDCRSNHPPLNSDYGELTCENCRCIEGTYSMNNSPHFHVACHWVECYETHAVIHIGNETVSCNFTGGHIEVPNYNGVVYCPNTDVLCAPKPCINNCSGKGKCEYGVCMCDNGTQGGDCGETVPDFSYREPNKWHESSLRYIGISCLMLFIFI